MSDANPYSPSIGPEHAPPTVNISTIEFELVEQDYIAFNLFVYQARGLYRRTTLILGALVLGIVGVLGLGLMVGAGESWLPDLLPVIIVLMLVIPLMPWLMKRSIRRNVKLMLKGTSPQALFGRHTLSISEDSVTKKNEYQYSELKWVIIDRLEITDDYLYIMPTGVSAHIIPREAFQSDGEFKGFCDLARRYFDAAHGKDGQGAGS